ncbi:MAG: hypothetical protein WDW36_005313 [Sanguina aurantia]
MLQLQFKSFKEAGGSYPHPLEVQYILSAEFGDPPLAVFQKRAGKALFYTDKKMRQGVPADTPQTLAQLRAFKIGDNLKSVFSNGATAAQVKAAKEWLLSEGFAQGQERQTITLHLKDLDANAQFSITLEVHAGGALSIQTIKTATTKVCFVTSVRPPDQLDARIMLIGHYSTQISRTTKDKLQQVGETCSFDSATSRLGTPGLAAMGLSLNHFRIKHKQGFHGTLQQQV